MEERAETLKKTGKKSKHFVGIVVVAFLLAVSGAIYYSQHQKVNNLNSKLAATQARLDRATKSATAKTQTPPTTFTYTPKVGGLSLTLPTAYGVIQNVDGNKGGAPGSTFRIADVGTPNVWADATYEGIQIDVDHTFSGLVQSVLSEESKLKEAYASSFETSDTTVAGLPAKLITADGGDEYVGKLAVYIVGSGEFEYTITQNGAQFDGASTVLAAVLKGLVIKPVTL